MLDNIIKWIKTNSTPNNLALVFFIIGLVVLGILLLELLFGKYLFIKTLKEKIEADNSRLKTKKQLVDYYKSWVLNTKVFLRRHKLLSTDIYKIEEFNIILERMHQKLISSDTDIMKYEDFVAANTLWTILFLIVGFLSVLFIPNGPIKLVVAVAVVLIIIWINVGHYAVMTIAVNTENEKFTKEFGPFYLSQHHILLHEQKNPLTKGLTLYSHIVKDQLMKEWTGFTLNLIALTSEAYVLKHYQTLYKDIAPLTRLFRLEEQLINGGEVELELKGLRDEIQQQRKIDIDINANKYAFEANMTIYLVFIVLVQALIGFIIVSLFNGTFANW